MLSFQHVVNLKLPVTYSHTLQNDVLMEEQLCIWWWSHKIIFSNDVTAMLGVSTLSFSETVKSATYIPRSFPLLMVDYILWFGH